MAHPLTWDEANEKLKILFPESRERGRIRAKLLDLEESKRVAYFQDDDEAVKESLAWFAGWFLFVKLTHSLFLSLTWHPTFKHHELYRCVEIRRGVRTRSADSSRQQSENSTGYSDLCNSTHACLRLGRLPELLVDAVTHTPSAVCWCLFGAWSSASWVVSPVRPE
jgi:hypothetical protein